MFSSLQIREFAMNLCCSSWRTELKPKREFSSIADGVWVVAARDGAVRTTRWPAVLVAYSGFDLLLMCTFGQLGPGILSMRVVGNNAQDKR
jgi:hypothetical protein